MYFEKKAVNKWPEMKQNETEKTEKSKILTLKQIIVYSCCTIISWAVCLIFSEVYGKCVYDLFKKKTVFLYWFDLRSRFSFVYNLFLNKSNWNLLYLVNGFTVWMFRFACSLLYIVYLHLLIFRKHFPFTFITHYSL